MNKDCKPFCPPFRSGDHRSQAVSYDYSVNFQNTIETAKALLLLKIAMKNWLFNLETGLPPRASFHGQEGLLAGGEHYHPDHLALDELTHPLLRQLLCIPCIWGLFLCYLQIMQWTG